MAKGKKMISWGSLLIIFFIIIFILWIFFGRQDHKFVGLKPLYDDSSSYLPSGKSQSTASTISRSTIKPPVPKNIFISEDKKQSEIIIPRKGGKVNKGEEVCREIFQKIFGKPFETCRPEFLVNQNSGHNLELDGYCSDVGHEFGYPGGIAFEYNGIQHYKYPNFFHRTQKVFDEQVQRDKIKIDACKESKICLITIPYSITYNQMESFIRDKLKENKIEV